MDSKLQNSIKIMDLNIPIKRSFDLVDIQATNAEEPTIEGHPAVYGQRTLIAGLFEEIIEPGAFDGCDFDDVLFSANHGITRIPLARSRRNNANSTMQLLLDEVGLKIMARLDTENNSESRSLYSAVQRGDINGMSFIFVVKEDRWEGLDTDKPIRHILKFRKVIEVSAVNFPAYAGTDISARDQAALDNVVKALENARSELDNSRAQALEVERLRTQILMKG